MKQDQPLDGTALDFSVAGRHRSLPQWEAMAQGDVAGFLYARNTPSDTVTVFENRVAELEGVDSGVAFTSGMAAITGVAMTFLAPGKRLVVGNATYGGATHLFARILPRWGVDVVMVPSIDEDAFRTAIAGGCDLLYLDAHALHEDIL